MSDQTVDIRVLSPSPEADGGISFSALPASMTVGELKVKIKDALPSHPAPERMRIIYLGRVVQNDTTLANALTREIQQGRVYNLHMVLSEAPTARSSTAPPNPTRAAPPPHHHANLHAQANHRPHSQPPRGDRAPAGAVPPFPRPPHIQPGIPMAHPALAGPMNLAQQAAMRQMQQMQQAMQNLNQNLNQRRAADGAPGANHNAEQASGGHAQPAAQQTGPANNALPQAPPNHFTFTQGGIGPNGERWSLSVNNSTVMFPPPQHPALGLPQLPMLFDTRPRTADMDRRMLDQLHNLLESAQNQVNVINGILAPSNASREDVWRMPPPQFQRAAVEIDRLNVLLNLMENLLNALVANPHYARNRELVSLQMDNESMRSATNRLIRNLGNHITARRQESQAAQRSASSGQADNASGTASDVASAAATGGHSRTTSTFSNPLGETPNNIFLLSSPTGPHAIVYSPEGTFTAPGIPAFSDAVTQNLAYQRALSDVARMMAPTHASLTDRQLPVAPQQHAAMPGAQANAMPFLGEAAPGNAPQNPFQNGMLADIQPQPQQQALQPQQDQGQMAIAAVVATHFWLLIRIFGMLWLFSGSGWRRTVMLSLCGLAIYVLQSGLLGNRFFGNRWDRVRRYFETLVGVPPQQRDQQQAAQGEGGNDEADGAGNANGRRGRRREPSPEEVAQRLLRERQQQQRNWFRERLRGVERSTALFVASLWPGLGERMVAAREEAEAQARRDAQDREDRERRAAAEAEAQAQAQAQAQEQETSGQNAFTGDERQGAAETNGRVEESADRADKGKGRAVETDEASSSSVAAPAAAEGSADGTESRQRDAWSFADLD